MKKLFILLLAGTPALGAMAQTAPAPDGGDSAVAADTSATEASAMDLGGTDQNKSNLRLGWLDVHPHLDYTVNYDDNIFIAPTNEKADFQHTISPGVLLGAGDYENRSENFAYLDYTPSIILFQENSGSDAVEQDVDFEAQYRFNKLTLGLRQGYIHLTGSDVQVGNRVDRDIFPTQFKADYEITEKTSVDADLTQVISDYKQQFDNTVWKISAYANYKPTAKIKLGIGPTVGWRDIESNPNQTFQQVNGRVIYDLTEKVTLRAKAGVGFRQTEGGYNKTSPVFGIGGTWTPFDSTTLTLDAYREEYSSTTLVSQNYFATGVSARIRQRFLQKFYLGIGGGYENSEYYRTSASAAPTNREDNYYYIRPSFDYQVTEWWSVGLFYMYRTNDSTSATNNFFNNQAGFMTSLAF